MRLFLSIHRARDILGKTGWSRRWLPGRARGHQQGQWHGFETIPRITDFQSTEKISRAQASSTPSQHRRCGWKKWHNSFLTLLVLLSWSGFLVAEDLATDDPNKVKAAFLRHFAHYVTWPDIAFTDTDAPWRICILGKDPFGPNLERMVKGRKEQGRPFLIYRSEKITDLPTCHIMYITCDTASERQTALAALKGMPVLTVGDADDFLQQGGIIRFQVKDRVLMSINLDQAHAASLTIQTKMLEVATEVLENGKVRKAK
jgi:hypothetical protein